MTGSVRTTFSVECQASHGKNYARGLCKACYDKRRRIDRLNERDFGTPIEKPVYRYEQWLDYQSCGYSIEFVADKWGIKRESLLRTIERGKLKHARETP